MWNDSVITNGGKALIAQWLDGGTFNFDGAAVGQGTVPPSLLMGQTKLVNQKQPMSIMRMETVEGGVRLQLQITSVGVETAYIINQIGIWASLSGGQSRLTAIYQDSIGISVPTFAEMQDYVFTFYALLQMNNEGELTVTIDTSTNVTHADLIAEANERKEADTIEAKARADADAAEAKARSDADTALYEDIEAETRARGDAINEHNTSEASHPYLRGELDKKADLDEDGKVPASQLPSYVDDVLEFDTKNDFPAVGESGKIYVDVSTNLTWRWSGTIYTQISSALALGETSSTAYRGDRGKIAYDHSQLKNGNPHGTKQIELITPLAVETEIVDEDYIVFQDTSAADAKRITLSNFKEQIGAETKSIKTAVVTLGPTPVYNGQLRTQTVASVVLNGQTLKEGTDYIVLNNTATNAGNYTLSITSIGRFSDSKPVSWTIAKATGSVSVNPTSVSLRGDVGETATVQVSYTGDGSISISNSNPGAASATLSGSTITLKSVNDGSTTVTVNLSAGANYTAASTTVAVSVTIVVADPVLNNNAWATIRSISDSGAGASYWAVGATKQVAVNGTVGTLAINENLWVFILGFNHNAAIEGNNKIHFQGFKTAQAAGIDVGLIDSGYGSYFTDGTKYFNQNHWGNFNYGGWAANDLRYDILGSTNVAPSNYGTAKATSAVGYDATATCATSPVANTLMAALPADLRAVMKPITKYSDNKGGGTDTPANVSATVDYLPLLAEFEVFGVRSYANSTEQNYQQQYAYYQNGNSKIKYRHSATASTASWWERSPSATSTTSFCYASANGYAYNTGARNSYAVAPAFAV